MNALDAKLNQLESELEQVKNAQMTLEMKKGQFDEHFKGFLKENGLPEQFTLIQLIKHFREKKSTIIEG